MFPRFPPATVNVGPYRALKGLTGFYWAHNYRKHRFCVERACFLGQGINGPISWPLTKKAKTAKAKQAPWKPTVKQWVLTRVQKRYWRDAVPAFTSKVTTDVRSKSWLLANEQPSSPQKDRRWMPQLISRTRRKHHYSCRL